MSFRSLLNKTCDIELKSTTQDVTGQKIESWSVAVAGALCRLEDKTTGKVTAPEVIFEKSTDLMFLLPQSIQITTKDYRINSEGIIYEILWVAISEKRKSVHHIELLLRREELK